MSNPPPKMADPADLDLWRRVGEAMAAVTAGGQGHALWGQEVAIRLALDGQFAVVDAQDRCVAARLPGFKPGSASFGLTELVIRGILGRLWGNTHITSSGPPMTRHKEER